MELESILNDLAPRLLRFCLGQGGDRGLAEEAAQDALAALVQRWRQHGPPQVPEAFAFAIARRRLRRAVWKRRIFAPLEAASDGTSPLPGPEAEAVQRADLRRTLEELARLPARQREALLLAATSELDGAHAARLLGISRSAFKMRVHRARQRLSQLLEVDHDHD